MSSQFVYYIQRRRLFSFFWLYITEPGQTAFFRPEDAVVIPGDSLHILEEYRRLSPNYEFRLLLKK